MHSRIFELSDNQLDYDECLASDNSVFDYFIGNVSDYVSDDVNRDKDIRCLLSHLSFDETKDKLRVDAEIITFYGGFIEKYFAKRYESFKDFIGRLTSENFCDIEFVTKIKNLINYEFGYYIYYKNGLYALDNFVRQYLNTEDNKTFYFGGIVNYHCCC